MPNLENQEKTQNTELAREAEERWITVEELEKELAQGEQEQKKNEEEEKASQD